PDRDTERDHVAPRQVRQRERQGHRGYGRYERRRRGHHDPRGHSPAGHLAVLAGAVVRPGEHREPPDRNARYPVQAGARWTCENPSEVRAEDDAEKQEFGARWQPESANGPPSHQHAAEIGERQKAGQKEDRAHGGSSGAFGRLRVSKASMAARSKRL